VLDTSPKLGQSLTLFCKVDNCTVDGTKRWHGGPDDKVLARKMLSHRFNHFVIIMLQIV
jgi:hypothetical protein